MTLDELAVFLTSDSAPAGSMDLSELDGFLAGLVAGPVAVPAAEWLAEIWDNDTPDYRDEAQKADVEAAILARYTAIGEGLDASTLSYVPILWVDDDGSIVAEDWAAGFMQAVSLRSADWQPALADDDASALLIPIASLAGMTLSDAERGAQALPDDAVESLAADAERILPVCVLGLWRFWRGLASSGTITRH